MPAAQNTVETMEVARMRSTAALVFTAIGLAVLTGCSSNAGETGSAAPTGAGPPPATAAAGSSPAATGAAVGATSPPPPANPKAAYEGQVVAHGRELARCARTHGLPRFPDPVGVYYDQGGIGYANFPSLGKGDLITAMDRCPEITRRVPHPPPPGPPSAATLRQMRQYSQCMRQHGISGFPDPRADGTFPIRGTRFAGVDPLSQIRAPSSLVDANLACRGFWHGWYPRGS
jgi:hypothetical protein